MRKLPLALAVLAALAAVIAGCGGDSGRSGGTALPECPPPPAPLTGENNLPPRFPVADRVVLTQTRAAGPTTVVNGYSEAGIPELFEAWSQALDQPPYSVVKSEQEVRDAEVNFSGEDTTGQVRLNAECEGRTSVQITARPL